MSAEAPGERFLELAASPAAELERRLAAGAAPSLERIVGWEWRGANTPWYARLLGIKKFIKGFFDSGQGPEGYNIPARQDGLEAPWRHVPSAEAPKRFGFYRVAAADPRRPAYPNALFLDYGASPRNARWRPERLLRDYLVHPDPEDPDLLLGKAYLALGTRVAVSYFVLERLRRSSWRPS